ncbi:hypothetical protein CPB86DRAFT_780332, partial [Serendipita vermifera]
LKKHPAIPIEAAPQKDQKQLYSSVPVQPRLQLQLRNVRQKNTEQDKPVCKSEPLELGLDTDATPMDISGDLPSPNKSVEPESDKPVRPLSRSSSFGKEDIVTHSDESSAMPSPTETILSSPLSPASTHSDSSQRLEPAIQSQSIAHSSPSNATLVVRHNERPARPQLSTVHSAPLIQFSAPPSVYSPLDQQGTFLYAAQFSRSFDAINAQPIVPMTVSLRELHKEIPVAYHELVAGRALCGQEGLASYPSSMLGDYILHSVGTTMDSTMGLQNMMDIDSRVNGAESEMDDFDTDEWLDIDYIKAQEESAQDGSSPV